MEFRLNSNDGVPVYRQIVGQVKNLVASGRLKPGQELPTIRALAERLVINPNTVVHAYAELAREGVVVCRHGSGTYVAEPSSRQPSGQALRGFHGKVDSVLTDAAHLNLGLDQVVGIVRDRHAALRPSKET